MYTTPHLHLHRHKQQGAVLITALVMLVILTLLGLTTMSTSTLEERMASNSQEVNRSFQTADTGLTMLLDDADALNTTAPYSDPNVNVGAYAANADIKSQFRQSVPMGRSSVLAQMWEAGKYSKFFFDLSSTGTTTSGVSTTLDGGAFQISKSN